MKEIRWLKRHVAVPALLAALVTIGAIGMDIYSRKDAEVIELKDLTGNRSELADIRIKGEYTDGYHTTSFQIGDGKVAKSTKLRAQPVAEQPYRYNPGMPKRIGEFEYEVMDIQPTIKIRVRKMNSTGPYASIILNAAASASDPSTVGTTTTHYANVQEYGLTVGNGKLYFTLPITRAYKGSTGIYEWNLDDLRFKRVAEESPLEARTVAEWPLVSEQENPGEAMDVIGLEAVGNSLALVAMQGDKLVVRGYDSASGKVSGEARIAMSGTPIAGERAQAGKPAIEARLNESYQAFSDPEAGTLTLAFHESSDPVGEWGMKIYSFDLSSGVKLVNETRVVYPDQLKSDTFFGYTSMAYRNGKLYMAQLLWDRRDLESDQTFTFSQPRIFLIDVYRNNEHRYEGELKSDMNQDMNQDYARISNPANLDYQFRTFNHVSFQSASREEQP